MIKRLDPDAVRYLVVHCSASQPLPSIDAKVIDRWHRERGFLKIGYHFVIKTDGTVELGRALDEVGAHAEGHNHCSIGICLVGGVNRQGKTERNFTEAQYSALWQVIADLREQWFPTARPLGHRDLSLDRNNDGVISPNEWMKDCPAFDVTAWWATYNRSSHWKN